MSAFQFGYVSKEMIEMEKIHAHQTSTFRTVLKSLGLLSHLQPIIE